MNEGLEYSNDLWNEDLEYNNDFWNADSVVDNNLDSELSSSLRNDDYVDELFFATDATLQSGACVSSEGENAVFSNDMTVFSRDEGARCLPRVNIGEESMIDAEILQSFQDPESAINSIRENLSTGSSTPPENPNEDPQPYIPPDDPEDFYEQMEELGWTRYTGTVIYSTPIYGQAARIPVNMNDDQKSWCRISYRPTNPFLIHLCCDGPPWGRMIRGFVGSYYNELSNCRHSKLFKRFHVVHKIDIFVPLHLLMFHVWKNTMFVAKSTQMYVFLTLFPSQKSMSQRRDLGHRWRRRGVFVLYQRRFS